MLGLPLCGSAPQAPASVSVTQVLNTVAGVVTVLDNTVTWTPSPDEPPNGARTVGLYVIERLPSGGTDWQVLFNQSATGASSYTYQDFSLPTGTWQYGVAAQNCSQINSVVTKAGSTVTNP